MRADRLIALTLLLHARGRMSAGDLAAELEVSVRTIYRDISALSTVGVPVLAEPGPNGGCRLLDGYRFPLRGLTADEAETLLLLGVPAAVAELGLAGSGPPRTEPDASRPALVHLDMPRWFHPADPTPHLRALAEAVRQRRRLRLGYRRDSDGPEVIRLTGPLGLVNKAGTWYLVAVPLPLPGEPAPADDAPCEPRVYRIGRISAAEPLPERFRRPADFDLVAFWDRWSASFMATRPKIEVRARANAHFLWALPYVFGDSGRQLAGTAGPPDEDGFHPITLTFEDERAAAYRLAGFGDSVEVLSPPGVRARLQATARAILSRYPD